MAGRRAITLWERLPAEQRAGSRIDHRFVERINATVMRGTRLHGIIDRRQRLYQCGGELSNFVFWKLRVVSLPSEVWIQIRDQVDFIEVIDHVKNRCYRAPISVCIEHGRAYQENIGPRWGVPLELWDVTDGPVEPERPSPAASASAATVTSAQGSLL